MIGKGFERFQTLLSKHVVEVDCCESVEILAGVDVSYRKNSASAACVLMDVGGAFLGENVITGRPLFPYVSSFFTLREFPLVFKVLKDVTYDLLFVHGHGRAHPRKCGLACHTGLYFGKPTIGVAGQRLVGEYEKEFEKWTYLYDKGDIIGAVLKTHPKMNPIFVSIGHMISLQSAIQYTTANVKDHKFPEVLRLAHVLSKESVNNIDYNQK